MSPGRTGRGRRRAEASLVDAARRHLEQEGFRVWVDPDGRDYFDLVARRADEVGLVEAKVADGRAVLAQALRRRAWGDWVAVVVASERTARALEALTRDGRAAPVGLWWTEGDALRILRAPRAWARPGEPDPFVELRARFRRVLDALESGALPSPVRWDGVVGEVRRASGGRGFREWRLDEPGR
ncbi:MAG TPA: hypothetical protein VEL82_03485 [Thermoplasmata archaeon]|nr:hypothetical protein [Thermoplasmata archaeon]